MVKNMEKLEDKVKAVLDEIRPGILAHGGDVKLKKVENNVVYLNIQGACRGCPMADLTFQMGVERELRVKIPEIKEVRYE